MKSLRVKFTLALLLSSLLSLAVAGLVARSILFRQFNQVVMDESFRRFQSEMTIYLQTYGTWERASKVESFGDFEKRRRPLFGGPPKKGLRSAEDVADNSPEVSSAIAQVKEGPPFRFALTNAQGRILMGNDQYGKGALAPANLRAQGKAIVVNGQTVAFALPDPQPNFNRLDLGYLQATRQALLYAAVAAGVLALALGVFIGTRLSRELTQLTMAIQSMGAGDLRQQVRVRSHDEIGVLAQTFNHMSRDLAQAHDELRASNEQIQKQATMLQELAIRDGLTNLYNRRHFDEQAEGTFTQAERYEHPLSVMIGDIDSFKRINDIFSHAVGDEVLRHVARLLQENTRESDIVARYGGEEFVITFPQTGESQAARLCEKLRSVVEDYNWYAVHPDLHVTISIGICSDTSLRSFEEMLRVADSRLYHAKESGRNSVCASSETVILTA